MAVSDVLKNLRQSDYAGKGAQPKEASPSPRTIKLSGDEMQALQPYQPKPGEEIVLEVTGRLENDGDFHVLSVKYAGGDMEEMKRQMMDDQPDMMGRGALPAQG